MTPLLPSTFQAMDNKVIPVEIRAVVPTSGGWGIFLGNEEKCFVISVDPAVGSAIGMFLNDTPKIRPQTHDLIGSILLALGAKVERIVVNDFRNDTYYGRLIISAENELQDRKVVEIDARPSDCIALALQQDAPIYIHNSVWKDAKDMTPLLEQLEREREDPGRGSDPFSFEDLLAEDQEEDDEDDEDDEDEEDDDENKD